MVPARAGVFVDFDGTLAPIVDDPRAARPYPGAVGVLRALAGRWGVVAVISGRPAAFLAEHLAGAGRTRLLGLYGMERAAPGSATVDTHPGAEPWRRVVEVAAGEAERSVGPGAGVERKGLSVTLHYRAAPDRAPVVQEVAAALAERLGLVAHDGKMSIELRPPVAVDKGTVVADLAAGLDAVVFAGDDTGDLPAFDALSRLRASGIVTLSIASDGPETPPEVAAAADVVVEGPAGVMEVLRELAAG